MTRYFQSRGFLSYPLGIALAGVGMLVIAAVQWPLALAMFCDAGTEVATAPAVAPDEPEQVAEADSPQGESVIPEQTAWRDDLRTALDEAQEHDKPVLAYFTADWCPPCQVMKQEVWPREAVRQRLHEDYIPLMIDVDDPRQMPVLQRYGIRSMPTMLVLDAEGNVQRTGSFMPLNAMIQFLDQASGRG